MAALTEQHLYRIAEQILPPALPAWISETKTEAAKTDYLAKLIFEIAAEKSISPITRSSKELIFRAIPNRTELTVLERTETVNKKSFVKTSTLELDPENRIEEVIEADLIEELDLVDTINEIANFSKDALSLNITFRGSAYQASGTLINSIVHTLPSLPTYSD